MQNVADALAATRTNTDHSEVALALLYNPSENMLYFTENLGAITSSDPLTPVVGVPLISTIFDLVL